MTHTAKVSAGLFSIFYLFVGIFFWMSLRTNGGSFQENIASILFFVFLWPLIIGFVIFYSITIPAILVIIISVLLAIKRRFTLALSLFFTIAILLSTLFLPVTITKQSDLEAVRMGLPLTFFIQDQSQYEPPLPLRTHVYSARENPTSIRWLPFMEDLIVSFIVVYSVFRTVSTFYRQSQYKRRYSEDPKKRQE